MTKVRTPSATFVAIGRAALVVNTRGQRDAIISSASKPDRATLVAFVNAHACNLAVDDPQLERDLIGADVLLRDGTGMALLCRALGVEPGLNTNGTDVIPLVLEQFRGRSVALLGTRDPWLGAAAAEIGRTTSVVLVRDGFGEEAEYLDEVRLARPELVLLGMGMPRQERLGTVLRDAVDHPCTIVCGGAILDFIGGKVSRAPAWMRRLGIEWTWRLFQEPRRLFKRYVVGNVRFVVRLPSVRRASRTSIGST